MMILRSCASGAGKLVSRKYTNTEICRNIYRNINLTKHIKYINNNNDDEKSVLQGLGKWVRRRGCQAHTPLIIIIVKIIIIEKIIIIKIFKVKLT